MYQIIQCRFHEFLLQLCRENAFFWDPCRNITTRSQCMTGFLCRAIFRVRAEILIFGEIYTSAGGPSLTSQNVKFKNCLKFDLDLYVCSVVYKTQRRIFMGMHKQVYCLNQRIRNAVANHILHIFKLIQTQSENEKEQVRLRVGGSPLQEML